MALSESITLKNWICTLFFDHLASMYVDIFYLVKVVKKLTFLNYPPKVEKI